MLTDLHILSNRHISDALILLFSWTQIFMKKVWLRLELLIVWVRSFMPRPHHLSLADYLRRDNDRLGLKARNIWRIVHKGIFALRYWGAWSMLDLWMSDPLSFEARPRLLELCNSSWIIARAMGFLWNVTFRTDVRRFLFVLSRDTRLSWKFRSVVWRLALSQQILSIFFQSRCP